jgi:hypothetical protein
MCFLSMYIYIYIYMYIYIYIRIFILGLSFCTDSVFEFIVMFEIWHYVLQVYANTILFGTD